MANFRNHINECFYTSDFVPDESSLVEWDGYDELEKKSAIKCFIGKDARRVLEILRKDGIYYLEEWTVLKPKALIHYAHAYFYYLVETLESDEPDEEFVFDLMGALYQLIYMHKGSPFTPQQTTLINELVSYAMQQAQDGSRFEYCGDDIRDGAGQYFTELSRYTT